ncbi:OprD family porin [Pseudomonas fragi]|jgi:imipenem/basic amino acid-specific outer membrane pore|uniref:OprD family porin n=1 Tax=Pseudomonas fragi TaxID=296 RepID=UPI000BA26120|nr:OprD family porin [Pseudomonas fragi]MBM1198285.1 OprD family porin [Pseudomonas fragi]NNB27173.1 OprD family porin [Pseudomonas fragi]NNB34903.1 OprD family porin [Pseudomonas fragi]PAA02621.1 outer membrane porin, OprD family [Pseudomonas fragi]
MSAVSTRSAILIALASPLALAESAQEQAKGLIEDSTWSVVNRTVYDNREYRHGASNSGARNAYKPRAERNGYAEEWAYGLMGTLQSGFTQGLIGVGVDAHAYMGLKLDSGGGRAGKARLLGLDNDGYPKDNYGRGGAALKLRMSNTVLSWGEQRVKTPVFSSSDSRLLPETATGVFLTSNEFNALKMVSGHFTESTDRNASSHDQGFVVNYSNGPKGDAFDLAGLVYTPSKNLSASLYTSRYENTWNQHYLGAVFSHALDENRSLSLNLNLYRTTDEGKALSGTIDNTTWSLLSTYAQGPHSFSLGYQKVHGDTPFDYVTRGAIFLTNAVQLSDFNAPNEQSWQARYDLAMTPWGMPGLVFSAAYVRGSQIDGTHVDPRGGYAYLGYGKGGKHWERDLEARYVVQSGVAKGTIMSLRHNVHRGNTAQAELDADQIRLAVEYPLTGRF